MQKVGVRSLSQGPASSQQAVTICPFCQGNAPREKCTCYYWCGYEWCPSAPASASESDSFEDPEDEDSDDDDDWQEEDDDIP